MTSASSPARLVVVDTDAFSILFVKSRTSGDRRAAAWRSAVLGRTVVIAMQTRAEILYGAIRAEWGAARVSEVRAQLDRTLTIPVGNDVAAAYATIQAACARVGHPLHQKQHGCDAWVAATAMAIRSPLLAGDQIYRGAPGLQLVPDALA